MTRRARLPATVIALGFTSLFTDIASEAVFPLLPGFLALLGAGPTFLGLLEGVADAVSALLKYQSGRWADQSARGGKKGFVLGGYALATVVRPLLAVVVAPWQVLAIRVTDRVGKGIRSAPRDALIAGSVSSEESGRAFGFHQAMDHAGAVIGPLLATALLWLGFEVRTVFALTIIPGVFAVASIFVVKEPERVVETKDVVDAAPLPARLKQLLLILGVFTLANSSDAFLLLRASELGVATKWLPMAWLALNLSKMFWASRGGDWSDRTARHRLILAGWTVYAVSYAGFAVANAPWHAWALLVFYGAFAGLTEPVEKALVKELTPKSQHGRAFGAYHATLGAMAVPSGLLTGFLWQQLGALWALGLGALVAVISSAALAAWGRKR